MFNDVFYAADEKCRSMIVLLDLSAAFDTIDIGTLLRHLKLTFGITVKHYSDKIRCDEMR